jgi:hypothetical protein
MRITRVRARTIQTGSGPGQEQAPRWPVVEALEPRLLLSAGTADAALTARQLGLVSSDVPQLAALPPDTQAEPSAGRDSVSQSSAFNPQVQVTAQVQKGLYARVGGNRMIYLGGPLLNVLGTDGDDAITLSQTADSITLTTPQGTTTYSGAFRAVAVYGFGGHDTIRLTGSVVAAVTVYDGNGGSAVYDAAQGASTVYCGSGGDTVVTIGSGGAQVVGGAGLDSFWVGAGDTVLNVSAPETAGGNLHVVSQFYGGVSLSPAGQSLADPALAGYASGYASFASHPLFADGPGYADVQQGALSDCYLLAPLASLAAANPNAVRQTIAALGDGTYAVRFYQNGSPVYLRIDADLPVTGAGSLAYAHLSASGEIWVPLIEKAYAVFHNGGDSYALLEGGWMAVPTTTLTNQSTQTLYSGVTDQAMYSFLATALAGGNVVTAGTKSTASGPVVASHAYMVQSVSNINGALYVTVYNPWGYDGVTWDSAPADGLVTLTLTQFNQYFAAAVAAV